MPTLAAIKVKIGLRPNGHHDHPDFNQLPVVQASGLDWAKYVDVQGTGWHYDRISGHQDDEPGSPFGTWFGMLLIPEQFAIEAMAQFPALVTRMTEAEAQAFYDDRAHVREDEFHRDPETLTGLDNDLRLIREILKKEPLHPMAKPRLEEVLVELPKALDPDDPTLGVRRNLRRKWATMKVKVNLVFQEAV